jgi:hypothetical protein
MKRLPIPLLIISIVFFGTFFASGLNDIYKGTSNTLFFFIGGIVFLVFNQIVHKKYGCKKCEEAAENAKTNTDRKS